MKFILATVCSAAIVAATALPALAQAVQTPQPGPNAPPMVCGDYKHNSDGSWATAKEVSLVFPDGTTLSVNAGTTFPASGKAGGGSYMGLPMSLLLDKQCGPK